MYARLSESSGNNADPSNNSSIKLNWVCSLPRQAVQIFGISMVYDQLYYSGNDEAVKLLLHFQATYRIYSAIRRGFPLSKMTTNN